MSANTVCHHGITFDHEAIESFCLENGIKKLALFGSVLREDFRPDSDIDMLVEFMPEEQIGYFELVKIERTLSEFLGNKKVDLRTPGELSRYFRERILKEAEYLYVR
ncbi:MAG: nucleotidyltransferase family protein [Candidatus Latescibacteria bacterium]|nr:nucleotidyltransferase family protein [Candidatus Latescibacterota bacterium]